MRLLFMLAASAALGVAMTLSVGTSTAIAKPKIVSNGCTAQQIQTPEAGQCIDKMQDDILHNRATTHAVYCSSTGRLLCCEYDAQGNTVDHSCEIISNISHPLLDFRIPLDNLTIAPSDDGNTGKGGSGAYGFSHPNPPAKEPSQVD